MQKNEVKVFDNVELDLKVRTILNPDGSISVNAEDTAIGYGWTQTQIKNGREYTSVRWERMNGFSADCGFPHEWGKDDYIPESLFYMLGFKAGNERALKYQQWLAIDVLPSLRKNGSYEMPKKLSATEQLRLQNQAILEVDEKVEAINQDLQQFKQDMPILGIEEDRITNAVKKKGVQCLGGKTSNAYKDHSLRQRLYRDIYRELYRQFGVSTYKAIKRSQCDIAVSIIDGYEPPLILAEQISDCNAQMSMSQEVA